MYVNLDQGLDFLILYQGNPGSINEKPRTSEENKSGTSRNSRVSFLIRIFFTAPGSMDSLFGDFSREFGRGFLRRARDDLCSHGSTR